MVTALAQIQKNDVALAEQATAAGIARYAKLRTWSRTDTGRWLNDRSPAVLAWLRRRPGTWPARCNQLGYWLKEYAPKLFDKAHARLAAGADDDARAALGPGEVLR